MVLESLISPMKGEKAPWTLFFLGLAYSSVALFLALWVFPEHASLVALFLTVLAAVPTMYLTISMEEEKDLVIEEERLLLKEHGKALALFSFLFLGFVVSFFLWSSVLPDHLVSQLFSVQSSTLERVNGALTGNATDIGGAFARILANNLRVLLFCLLFSFFYGTGAIFILTWNASLIGLAISRTLEGYIGYLAVPAAMLRYLLHGIPEMLAYFMAGLAGGIISIAIIRHHPSSEKFRRILVDSADLAFGAVAVLVVAALLEVFISPFVG